MQTKIIHRIYATDSYVSNFDDTVSATCKYCYLTKNIIHWFSLCCKLESFWKLFEMWLSKNLDIYVILNPAQIIFGYLEPDNFIVNYCILHAKQYIHKKHLSYQGTTLWVFSFTDILEKLKYALDQNMAIRWRNSTKRYSAIFYE